MKITVVYKSGRYDEFDNVTSVEIPMGPSRLKLTPDQIQQLHMFSTAKDIYVFNSQSHLIERNSIERLTVSD